MRPPKIADVIVERALRLDFKLELALMQLYITVFRKFPFIMTSPCRGFPSVSPAKVSPQFKEREYYLPKYPRHHLKDVIRLKLDDSTFIHLLREMQNDENNSEVNCHSLNMFISKDCQKNPY